MTVAEKRAISNSAMRMYIRWYQKNVLNDEKRIRTIIESIIETLFVLLLQATQISVPEIPWKVVVEPPNIARL